MRRNPQPDLELVPQIDWARLAAYIDGEGHIGVRQQVHRVPLATKTRYDYIGIGVANTDPRLTQWLLHNFGGSVQVRQQDLTWKRWKPVHNWLLFNGRAAEVLRRCLPYFIIKREQAELCIAFQSTMCRSGRRGTPAHVMEQREGIKSKLRALNARGPRAVAVNE